MDKALVKFVGAGLSTVVIGLGRKVPVGAIANGHYLVSHLLETNPSETRQIIEGVVREIFIDWKKSGVPMSVADTHLEALPQVLDQHRVAQNILVGGLAVAKKSAKDGRRAVTVPARRIASEFVTLAREAQSLSRAKLADGVSFFLVERAFAHLLMERQTLIALTTPLNTYFMKSMWLGPVAPGIADLHAASPAAAQPEDATVSPATNDITMFRPLGMPAPLGAGRVEQRSPSASFGRDRETPMFGADDAARAVAFKPMALPQQSRPLFGAANPSPRARPQPTAAGRAPSATLPFTPDAYSTAAYQPIVDRAAVDNAATVMGAADVAPDTPMMRLDGFSMDAQSQPELPSFDALANELPSFDALANDLPSFDAPANELPALDLSAFDLPEPPEPLDALPSVTMAAVSSSYAAADIDLEALVAMEASLAPWPAPNAALIPTVVVSPALDETQVLPIDMAPAEAEIALPAVEIEAPTPEIVESSVAPADAAMLPMSELTGAAPSPSTIDAPLDLSVALPDLPRAGGPTRVRRIRKIVVAPVLTETDLSALQPTVPLDVPATDSLFDMQLPGLDELINEQLGGGSSRAIDASTPDAAVALIALEPGEAPRAAEPILVGFAPESGGMVLAPESGGMVLAPESGRMVLAPESGRMVLAPESGGMVLAPEPGGMVLAPESGGMVLAPEPGAVPARDGYVAILEMTDDELGDASHAAPAISPVVAAETGAIDDEFGLLELGALRPLELAQAPHGTSADRFTREMSTDTDTDTGTVTSVKAAVTTDDVEPSIEEPTDTADHALEMPSLTAEIGNTASSVTTETPPAAAVIAAVAAMPTNAAVADATPSPTAAAQSTSSAGSAPAAVAGPRFDQPSGTVMTIVRTGGGEITAATACAVEFALKQAGIATGDGVKSGCKAVVSVMQRLAARVAEADESADLCNAALGAMRAGQFDDARLLLSKAEAAAMGEAHDGGDMARTARRAAVDLRILHADFEVACGRAAVAAAHLGEACSAVPADERVRRWSLAVRRARLLGRILPAARHDAASPEQLALVLSAYRDALTLLTDQEEAQDYGRAQGEFAVLLNRSSRVHGRIDELNEAATFIDQTIETLARARAMDDWAEAHVQRGVVYAQLARYEDPREHLERAIYSLNCALGQISSQRSLVAWSEARAWLGLVLKQMAKVTRESSWLAEGVTHLRAVCDAESIDLSRTGLTIGDVALELGDAINTLSAQRSEPGMHATAVAAIARVIGRCEMDPNHDGALIGLLYDRLSDSLWQLGGHRQDVDMLDKAARAMERGIELLLQAGEETRAEERISELERLHDYRASLIEHLQSRDARLELRMA